MKPTIVKILSLIITLSFFLSCNDEKMIEEFANNQTDDQQESVIGENAQEGILVCGTDDAYLPEDFMFITPLSRSGILEINKEIKIRTYYHLVKSSVGRIDNSDYNNITSSLNVLNTAFNKYCIQFVNMGVELIKSNYLCNLPDSLRAQVFSVNPHEMAIDIYLFSNFPDSVFYNGVTQQAGHAAPFWIQHGKYNSSTMIHEMGHSLGLHHTHKGTDAKENGTPELVNGSNSTTAGDLVGDTPADPNVWRYGVFAGHHLTDANGDHYNPDPYNVMSYSGNLYRYKLSHGQIQRILNMFSIDWRLMAVSEISDIKIDGPTYILNSGSYQTFMPYNSTIEWDVKVYKYSALGQISDSVTVTSNDEILTLTRPSGISQKFKITSTVTSPDGYQIIGHKTAYHAEPSNTTGLFRYARYGSSGNGGGNLSFGTTNTIRMKSNDEIYFYYADACGLNSTSNPDDFTFNFGLGNYFERIPGTTHGFRLINNSGTTDFTIPVIVTCHSANGIAGLRFIVEHSNNSMSNDDEIEEMVDESALTIEDLQ